MATISFSVEDKVKQDIARIAKSAKKSKSDVFRDMVLAYKFNEQLNTYQEKTAKALIELNIQSEQDLLDYLESDQTYADRV